MDSPLLAQFDGELVAKVQLVAQAALANAEVHQLNSLAADIRSVFDIALASLFRSHNSIHSAQHRLPDEIWCRTWGYLPLEGAITVSHVCHRWRSVSISCPRLWCDLRFWSSLHSDECDCEHCCPLDGPHEGSVDGHQTSNGDTDCESDDHEVGSAFTGDTGRSKLEEVTTLLPRSRQLPLTLQITVSPYRGNLESVYQLLKTLQPHYQRLESIRFYSLGHRVADAFFWLRVLVPLQNAEWFRLLRQGQDANEQPRFRLEGPEMEPIDNTDRLALCFGDDAHTRTLSFPWLSSHADRSLTAKWNARLDKLHAPIATVDLALLTLVPPRVALRVRSLIVKMPWPACLTTHLSASIPSFPVLDKVEFAVDAPTPSAVYPEETIFDIARLLRPDTGSRLGKIMVSGALLDGEGRLLASITDNLAHPAQIS